MQSLLLTVPSRVSVELRRRVGQWSCCHFQSNIHSIECITRLWHCPSTFHAHYQHQQWQLSSLALKFFQPQHSLLVACCIDPCCERSALSVRWPVTRRKKTTVTLSRNKSSTRLTAVTDSPPATSTQNGQPEPPASWPRQCRCPRRLPTSGPRPVSELRSSPLFACPACRCRSCYPRPVCPVTAAVARLRR